MLYNYILASYLDEVIKRISLFYREEGCGIPETGSEPYKP